MSQTSSEKAPDVRQLGKENLPESAFPGGRNQAFRVFFDPEVHAAIQKHAVDTSSVEICGILVGKWARDADGPYVTITASIKGEAATNKFAEVTFTHETWAKINEQMDTRYRDFSVVGWYHSHPDFGVFLSDRDRFIQEHFFAGPGQVAYVVDPIRRTEGMFLWRQGKPTLTPHYWVGERVQIATGAQDEQSAPVAKGAPKAAAAAGNMGRPSEPPAWINILTQAGLYLAVFLLGVLLSGKWSDLERLRIQQSTLARAWIFLKIRPGLNDELDKVGMDLASAAKEAKLLAREHLKVTEEPKAAEERWKEVLSRLERSFDHLRVIKDAYGLTPDEVRLLESLGRDRDGSAPPKTRPEERKDKPDKDKPLDKEKPDKATEKGQEPAAKDKSKP